MGYDEACAIAATYRAGCADRAAGLGVLRLVNQPLRRWANKWLEPAPDHQPVSTCSIVNWWLQGVGFEDSTTGLDGVNHGGSRTLVCAGAVGAVVTPLPTWFWARRTSRSRSVSSGGSPLISQRAPRLHSGQLPKRYVGWTDGF